MLLQIFFEFFSRYREILLSTIYMPNFRSIGPFKEKLQRGGGRICPSPAIPICKNPGLFRVNRYSTTVRRISSDIPPRAISLLFFQLEWNICFIIHQIHNPEWCIRKYISNSKKIIIELQVCNSEYVFKRHVRFMLIYKN